MNTYLECRHLGKVAYNRGLDNSSNPFSQTEFCIGHSYIKKATAWDDGWYSQRALMNDPYMQWAKTIVERKI